jgi:hypothetical protein
MNIGTASGMSNDRTQIHSIGTEKLVPGVIGSGFDLIAAAFLLFHYFP